MLHSRGQERKVKQAEFQVFLPKSNQQEQVFHFLGFQRNMHYMKRAPLLKFENHCSKRFSTLIGSFSKISIPYPTHDPFYPGIIPIPVFLPLLLSKPSILKSIYLPLLYQWQHISAYLASSCLFPGLLPHLSLKAHICFSMAPLFPHVPPSKYLIKGSLLYPRHRFLISHFELSLNSFQSASSFTSSPPTSPLQASFNQP